LEQADVKMVLGELAADPKVRSIRQILNNEPSWPRNGNLGELLDNSAWQAGFRELQTYKLSFDMQLNPHQFAKAAAFLAGHKETTVIINHMGCPLLKDLTEDAERFWSGMTALAALPNTYIKLSMLCYADANWDTNKVVVDAVHRVIALFGTDRCMFASNYPVDIKDGWPAERLFPAFLKIAEGHSEEERQRLFGGSAKQAYRFNAGKA